MSNRAIDAVSNVMKASGVCESLRQTRPGTKQDLWNYVKVFLGIDVPVKRICPEHCSPMDYLWHVYNCDFAKERKSSGNGDCVVWANRGGGKTQLAAIATLLDCIFKPRCQVRILGGSLEQSGRMYDYLDEFLHRGFEHFLSDPIRKDKCGFLNGSSVEVMPQSAKNVRGRHIHKLRCDEVELFDERVFTAAKARCIGLTDLCRNSWHRLMKMIRRFSSGAFGRRSKSASATVAAVARCGAIAEAGQKKQTAT